MRIKIETNIISKVENKTGYNHEMYSMILALIPKELATKIHDEKKKTLKLFTFSRVYISPNKDKCHFYVSGKEDFILEIIKGIENNSLLRLGDMVLNVNNITECSPLVEKRCYLFRGNIIASNFINSKKRLIEDDEELEQRIKAISSLKLDRFGVKGEIDIEIIKKSFEIVHYKDGIHIASYNAMFLVKGDYEAVKTIYDIGFGENTATGHGLVWEV